MTDEFDLRFSAAKSARTNRVEDDGFDVYKFCFNGREEEWTSRNSRNQDPVEIFADMVAGVAEDFAGDLFHTMTPENTDWVEYEAGAAVPEENVDQVEDFIGGREKAISKALKQSNYYDEGPTAFQDAVMGNVAMWADRFSLTQPITFEAIPLSECYFRLGPMGIDDRFRESKYFYRDLPQLLPGATFPRLLQEKINGGGKGSAKVVWGFWKDYSDPDAPIWVQNVRVDGKAVGLDKKLEGEGSCPMLVGRFNPRPKSPWGWGPGRRMLPTMGVLDELVRMNLESMDHTLDPAYSYVHDGVTDFSEGLEPGVGYPRMPGSEAPAPIIRGDLDYGFFTEERIEEKLREGFYRTAPQRGKTPPSASQYMGEEQKDIRRMARPAGKLWKEFGLGLLKRVEWLETQPGGSLDGEEGFQVLDGQLVSMRPISPLERAQARDEVLASQGLMQMTAEGLGPEQAAVLIDGPRTMRNVKEKLKDKLVEFRTEDQIKTIMQQAQQQENPDAQQ